jgi:hypothetical protein
MAQKRKWRGSRCCLYLLRFFVLMFRSEDWVFTLIFGGATLFFMMVGIMGLRNVLRVPARP